MAIYEVEVTAISSATSTVSVEADSIEEAKKLAEEEANNDCVEFYQWCHSYEIGDATLTDENEEGEV